MKPFAFATALTVLACVSPALAYQGNWCIMQNHPGRPQQQVTTQQFSDQPTCERFALQHHLTEVVCIFRDPRNQSGSNQGGFNQGGSNQGGFNQGGFNQGGSNQGGWNQGGSNQGNSDHR